jgi:transcriptional regulator with XRE-family HTH domain
MRDVEFIESVCDRFMLVWEASGMSKQDFAASVGLTGPQLANIKTYRNPPPLKAMAEAARVYGLTTDFFLSGNLGGMRDQNMATTLRQALNSKRRDCAA